MWTLCYYVVLFLKFLIYSDHSANSIRGNNYYCETESVGHYRDYIFIFPTNIFRQKIAIPFMFQLQVVKEQL